MVAHKKIFIIAEAGINHNGDIDIAKQLCKMAKDNGCDAIKFQKRDIDLVYSKETLDTPRVSPWGTTTREQKMGLEFGQKEYDIINEYCKSIDLEWFVSAWDYMSYAWISQYKHKYNKIASPMLACEDFLKIVAHDKKYTFISTGMSTVEQIDKAVKIFRAADCPFELMHCRSTYPMADEDANLRAIETLRARYCCDVGYSGHENGIAISYAAAALGATSIERHITLSRVMYGTDQAASIEADGLKMMCGAIRKIELALGDGKLGMIDKEIPVMKKLRSHIAVPQR